LPLKNESKNGIDSFRERVDAGFEQRKMDGRHANFPPP
jgi:hypothetical protein